MSYLAINPEDGFLLDKHFPDIIREPTVYPSAYNGAILRCQASLEVLYMAWYRPPVTYRQKHYRPKGYQRHDYWRD